MVVPFYISYLWEILLTVDTFTVLLGIVTDGSVPKTEDGLHPAVSNIQPRFNLYIKAF